MELLNLIVRESIDPGYVRQPGRTSRHTVAGRIGVTTVFVIIGGLLAIAGVQNRSDAVSLAQERANLIARVRSAQQRNADLSDQVSATRSEITTLGDQELGPDTDAQQLYANLGALTGASQVSGPGIVVTLDDPAQAGAQSRVIDEDLAITVDGLWSSGAEAIAINGQRLSSRTAIREAGSAITVNYVSINPPYRIEAIGDSAQLPGLFGSSQAAAYLASLRDNYGVSWKTTIANHLTLDADRSVSLSHATAHP